MNSSFYIRLSALLVPAIIGYLAGVHLEDIIIFTSYIFLLASLATKEEENSMPESRTKRISSYNKYSQFLSV